MKTKYFVAGIVSAILSSSVAAEPAAVLLKAKSLTAKDRIVVALDATAIIGEMQISAADITFDKDSKILKCAGETTIRANGVTVKAHDATIEVAEKKLFTLSAGVIIEPEGRAAFDFTKKLDSPPQ